MHRTWVIAALIVIVAAAPVQNIDERAMWCIKNGVLNGQTSSGSEGLLIAFLGDLITGCSKTLNEYTAVLKARGEFLDALMQNSHG